MMTAAAAAPATAMKIPATLPIIVGAAALELVVRAALAAVFEPPELVTSLSPSEVGEPLLSPVGVASSLPGEASEAEVSSELGASDVLVLWAVVVVVVAKREAVRQ
jgi:hypothetical protein